VSSDTHRQAPDQAREIIGILAQREEDLERRNEDAKAEAEAIMEQARAEASSILARAREGLERLKAEQREDLAKKARQTMERKMGEAREQAKLLEQQAEARRKQAVELIVKQVLPES
jgi:vacuolar-type H+-ATPase subunit H